MYCHIVKFNLYMSHCNCNYINNQIENIESLQEPHNNSLYIQPSNLCLNFFLVISMSVSIVFLVCIYIYVCIYVSVYLSIIYLSITSWFSTLVLLRFQTDMVLYRMFRDITDLQLSYAKSFHIPFVTINMSSQF